MHERICTVLALAPPAPCAIDGCDAPAARGGYCWGHLKRRQRNLAVGVLLARKRRDLFASLTEAALAYAEAGADSDAEWESARERLRKAAMRYAAAAPSIADVTLGIVRECREAKAHTLRAVQLPLF